MSCGVLDGILGQKKKKKGIREKSRERCINIGSLVVTSVPYVCNMITGKTESWSSYFITLQPRSRNIFLDKRGDCCNDLKFLVEIFNLLTLFIWKSSPWWPLSLFPCLLFCSSERICSGWSKWRTVSVLSPGNILLLVCSYGWPYFTGFESELSQIRHVSFKF